MGTLVLRGSSEEEAAFLQRLAAPKLPAEPLRRLRANGMNADERTFGRAALRELGRGSRSESGEAAAAVAEYPYLYRTAVFHLEPIALQRLQREAWLPAGGGRPSAFVDAFEAAPTWQSQRAVREAVKALYALGLDYGEADIGIRPDGRLVVLDVRPRPDAGLGDRYAEAVARCAAEYARERVRTEPATLGSDPEFLLLSAAGKVVPASRFLERDGEAGCDAIVLRGHRVITPLAELRPRPSRSPRQLAANLQRAMRLAASRIGDASLAWLAGGMPLRGFPLGGHIHFSRVWLNPHLLRALDNYLALPLMLIEADTTRHRRPRYGFLGDFRRQPHGGFEYRTLPSWMVTPQVTVGVFSLARLIADGYPLLPSRPLDDLTLLEAYYEGDKTAALPTVVQQLSELERLPGYPELAADIEPLKARILRMEPWNERADFRRSWKIPPFDGKRAASAEIML